MRTIYVDSAFRCFTTAAEDRRAVETDVFDNLCENAIETMVFVPAGEIYKGVVCAEGFVQCTDSKLFDAYQKQYQEQLAETEAIRAENEDMKAALEVMEVEPE